MNDPKTHALSLAAIVRYLIDEVEAAVAFYTKLFGFTVEDDSGPAFADVFNPRLRAAGATIRRENIVSSPRGSRIWVVDPSDNLVEAFEFHRHDPTR